MTRETLSSAAIHFAGRACRLPGAPSVQAFADLLRSGTSAIGEIPPDRWRTDPFHHPVPGTKGKAYSFAAGVLDGLADFDPAPFGISPREAEYMDPQQRLMLQVVWEALEDACIRPSEIAGTNVGVYIGASMMDHGGVLSNDPVLADGYMMTGSALAVIANRVSHVFDLHGPSMTIDTACSSSLFALHAASRALSAGEIDTAIVGATNVLMSPAFFIGFSEARMLSPTGRCQAFSEGADGYVRGEGAVAFVLRRADAGTVLPRDHGRLVHVGVNTTGRSVNIALPSADAQAALLEQVYRDAGVNPDQLAFVEAHGTGTPVGDPIEAEALGRVLGRRRSRPLPIGSVKTNIGHLEPAAGAAGLLKALIALEDRCLPSSLHASRQNPAIAFTDLNLAVAGEPVALDLDDPDRRLAGVSAFGFGGANAHAILRAPEPVSSPVIVPAQQAGTDRLFVTSAFSRETLTASAAAYRDRLFDDKDRPNAPLLDALVHFRDAHPERMAVVAADRRTTVAAIDAAGHGETHPALVTARSGLVDEPPVFLFSGNGAQYPGMSIAALEADAAYRACHGEVDACWQQIAGWSLEEAVRAPDLAERILSAEIAQPLLFADQVSTVAALAARGVVPAAVLGHSGGEVAAAVTSGALGLADGLAVLHARSRAQSALAGLGGMAALQVPLEEVEAALAADDFGGVAISAVNSPRSVTVSGPVAALDAFQRHARRERRWAAVRLKVNYAFHHAMQDGTEETFRALLSDLSPRGTKIPFISSVTGLVERGERLDGDYWWRNVRRPVLFRDAVETAAARGHRCLVEIGPDPVLGGYARDCLRELPEETAVAHTLSRGCGEGVNPIMVAAARILVHGGRLDLSRIARRPRRAVDGLATYPWQVRPFRIHDQSGAVLRSAARAPDYHPLLGREIAAEARIWMRDADLHLVPGMADHRVAGRTLMPGTGLAEMAVAAAQRALGTDRVELRDLDLLAPLALLERSLVELRTVAAAPDTTIRISSRPRFADDPWLDHAACRAFPLAGEDPGDPAPDADRLPDDLDGGRLYDKGAEIGLDYGPAFRRAERYRIVDDETIEVIVGQGARDPRHALDPVAADAVLHGLIGLLEKGRFADELLGFVPVRIARLVMQAPGRAIGSGRIRVRRVGERSILADIGLFDGDGRPVALMEGMRLRAARLVQQVHLDRHAFGLDVVPLQPERATLPPAADVISVLEQAAPGDDADDALLLMDAVAHRIALDAMSGLAGTDGVVRASACPDADARRLAAHLGSMLVASGLAEPAEGGHRLLIAAAAELPAADLLISGLLAERPDLGAECALLARLTAALPALLAGGLAPDGQTVFGRAALANLTSGSASRRRWRDWLAAALSAVIGHGMQGGRLRIAEVVHGEPILIDALAAGAGPLVDWVAIRPDGAVSGGVAMPQATRTVDAAGAADAGPFDLIVECAPMLSPGSAAELVQHLSPGGMAISIHPAQHDHLDLIRMAIRGATAVAPDDLAAGMRDAVAGDVVIAPPIAVPGGGVAIVASAPSLQAQEEKREARGATASAETGHDMPSIFTALRAAGGDFAGQVSICRHDEADLWFLAPWRPGASADCAPLVVFAPDRAPDVDGDRVLRQRLLCLSRLVHAAPAAPKPIWLVAPGGAGHGDATPSPVQAAIWAAWRTARNEYPVLELKALDPVGGTDRDAARLIGTPTEETELVLRPSGPHALRVRVGAADPGRRAGPPAACARLVGDPAGGLDSLSWRSVPMPEPGPREVLVEVEATGLNYRDVMWAMGLLPEEALEGGMAGPSLGIECSGRVIAAGAEVDGLKTGDRVVAIGPASFATHVTVGCDWVFPVPEGMSSAAGASLPVAFFTAFYGLSHLANLSAGETVLIHGGAGGVGLAAIQVAQAAGARIIATAGSDVKRSLLHNLGVAHVLDSRSHDFDAEVRLLTGGRGVDVVLNSLNGAAMERSMALLAPFGRFVELGKQDYYANTAVGLRALKDNIAYFSADLDQLLAHRPALARLLFAEMLERFGAGVHGALPVREFDGARVVDAFRAMQRSDHIGKIVVRPPDPALVRLPEAAPVFAPDPHGTMVIAGGGNGLGLGLAERMVTAGATAVALIGRSPEPTEEARALIARAARRGAEILYVPCDIASEAELERALAAIRSRRPITDVVHSAMVLEDMRLADLSEDVLERAMAAKVAGVRNLDRATRGDRLRSFTVFTSMATLIGNHGQGAYVAANAYMEAVVQRRRAEGLPGLALGWGAITDTGYLTRNQDRAKLVRRMSGNVDFTARQALRVHDLLAVPGQCFSDDAVLWISPMSWRATAQGLRVLQGPTHRALRDLGQQSGAEVETDDLRGTLMALAPGEARVRLSGFLTAEIARILRISEAAIPLNRPVSDIGVDSLMGVELGLAAQQALGDDVPLMTISSANSIAEIAEKIVEHVHGTSGDAVGAFIGDLVSQHATQPTPVESRVAHATAAE